MLGAGVFDDSSASFSSDAASLAELHIELKKYCRVVTLDGDTVLYDSLNMNTIRLSPALAEILKRLIEGASLKSLVIESDDTGSYNKTDEHSLLLALLALASLKTLSVNASD